MLQASGLLTIPFQEFGGLFDEFFILPQVFIPDRHENSSTWSPTRSLSSCPNFLKWVTQCLTLVVLTGKILHYRIIPSSLISSFTARSSTPGKPSRFTAHRARWSLTFSSLTGFLPAATTPSEEVIDTDPGCE